MTREEMERRIAALEIVLGEALAALLTGPETDDAFERQKRLVAAVNGTSVEARSLLDRMTNAQTASDLTARLRSVAPSATGD